MTIGFGALPSLSGAATVATADGPVPLGWLRAGDLVVTRDRGLQPILGTGRIERSLEQLRGNMGLWPIRIAEGALGHEAPVAELVVSPDQQLLLRGAEIELLFGLTEALVAAQQLLSWDGIECVMPDGDMVSYQPILEQHELLLVDGCWTASLFLEAVDIAGLGGRAPDWAGRLGQGHVRPARSSLDDWEVQLLTPPASTPRRGIDRVQRSA